MKTYSYKLLGILLVLVSLVILSFSDTSRAYTCLPTCTDNDARFLTFGGQGINSFVFDTISFGIGSRKDAPIVEIGIFDGDSSFRWDSGPEARIEYTLFADPLGDGSGTFQVAQWSSDGSFGNNTGNPMPDNRWFTSTVNNVVEAQAVNGNYLYLMVVTNLDTNLSTVNNYKVRTDGTLFIFPTDQPFGYEASARGTDEPSQRDVFQIIYPNLEVMNPDCTNLGQFCDLNDPNCCLFGSTYDGDFNFFFFLEGGQNILNFWDGDFDFGPLSPSEGPPFIDTDDPNTPPGIPSFADVPNTNPQTSAGSIPPDDQSLVIFLRKPNIIYELISPDGNIYMNENPSATNEWELFQLNTEPDCEPNICDIQVGSIPGGIWQLRIIGADLANINFIRGFDRIIGVDEREDPIPPLGPEDPEPVPTISEWGMLLTIVFLGIAGLYYARRKENANCK